MKKKSFKSRKAKLAGTGTTTCHRLIPHLPLRFKGKIDRLMRGEGFYEMSSPINNQYAPFTGVAQQS